MVGPRDLLGRPWGLGVAAALLFWAAAGGALGQPRCEASYFRGLAPAVVGAQTDPTHELCYTHFAVLHSSEKLTGLWSAQRLTKADADGGDQIKRRNAFHAEKGLPAGAPRAKLADYTGFKGRWDRGHLTPADDMPDYPTQKETYTLANMVPHATKLNQGTWQYLEASLHVLAQDEGELYLVTGPIFAASPPRLKKRVAIPEYTFKAVYSPLTQRTIAYVATNRNVHQCWVVSVDVLVEMSGIDPFPGLDAALKRQASAWVLPPGTNNRPVPACAPQ